jgi:hypothetical protein
MSDEIHNNFFVLKPNIRIDNNFIEQIKKMSYSLESVLKNTENIKLPFVNFYGSTWTNQMGCLPKEISENLIEIIKYVGLKIVGADILITDKGELKIFEFNCYPSTVPHHFITYGRSQPVVQKIFSFLFNTELN